MNVAIQRRLQPLRVQYAEPVVRRLLAFWEWWTSELFELLPEAARRVIARQRRKVYVEAGCDLTRLPDQAAAAEPEVLRLPLKSDWSSQADLLKDVQQTVLLMPDHMVLSKRITLPMAAEENLREVLAFEMDLHTPFAADDVHYDYTIVGRDPGRKLITVDLAVAPRAEVEALLAEGAGQGLHFDVVTCRRPGEIDHEPVNLLPADRRAARRLDFGRLNSALAISVAVLLVAAIAVPIVQKNRAIAGLESQVAVAAASAREGSALRKDLENMAAASQFLNNKKQDATLAVERIDEVSRILPDHTWVSRLDLSMGELQIQGQSQASATLIGIIESSPYFQNARFRSPVVQVRGTDRDRFFISADVIAGDAP